MAGRDLLGWLVGQNDRVEALPQRASLDVRIGDGLEIEFILLEQPTSPALVRVVEPRLIKPDARAANRLRIRWQASARRGRAKTQVPRDCLDGLAHALAIADQ